MTWSGFRPSDDACVYGYNIPANAFAAVSLDRLARPARGRAARRRGAGLGRRDPRAGSSEHGIVEVEAGRIYAYEVDGLGGTLLLDDANVPSLLSLPYLGFCEPDDPLYRSTRDWVLGPRNPSWVPGPRFGRRQHARPARLGLAARDRDGRPDRARGEASWRRLPAASRQR